MNYNPLHLLALPPTALDPKPIPTSLTLDPFSDVLWVGTSCGIVSALCSPLTLTRNVHFPAHGCKAGGGGFSQQGVSAVREVRVTDRDVWTLTEGGIGGRKRGGAPKWTVSDVTRSLRTMSPNPTNSHELITGGAGSLLLANTARGEVVRSIENSSPVVKLAPLHRTVLAAGLSGQVTVLDPRTGFKAAQNISSVQAHTGGLSGADVQGNIVATWGWTHMQGHPLPDPLIRLYDVRALRPLPPISFPSGPAFALLHPSSSSHIVVSSQQGMLQTIDMSLGPSASVFQQLDVSSYVTSMALSSRGDYLAFGDADGQLHVWTTNETGEKAALDENGSIVLPPFNGYEGVKPEWPDQVDPLPTIAWEDSTPLNLVGMPYYNEALLSQFPSECYATPTSPLYNPPVTIPQPVLSSMKMVDFVGYAPNPKELRGKRYVLRAAPGAENRARGKGRRDSGPRFRSEKDKKGTYRDKEDIEEEVNDGEIPKYYRKVEIKYSKFGIEDFDFEFYNRTNYSGLETDILNSYTNSLLQALHYTLPLRAVATAHICVDCKKEHCLLCEAGFLFRMLEDAKGRNCQASNFSRAFSATSQAYALGLMDENTNSKSTAPYGSLIQNFNRWLLSTFSTESIVDGETFHLPPLPQNASGLDGLSVNDGPSAIDQILGVNIKTTNTCRYCGFVSSRDSTLHAVDLVYPKKTNPRLSFSDILRSSLIRDSTTKAICSSCKAFAPLDSRRGLSPSSTNPLPPVLSVNAMVTNSDVYGFWKDKKDAKQKDGVRRFLPKGVTIRYAGNLENDQEEEVKYSIRSMVVQIQESPDAVAHLVSFVKMPSEDDSSTWIMFNDFLVRPVSEDEVLSFPDQWKVPAVIILERENTEELLNLEVLPKELDREILFKDVSIAWNRKQDMIKHKILQRDEMPKRGTLVAIDAEFVALQQEEMEFRSDGTKNILRPSHMSLARVSVLRGEGEMEGTPFIDDYIHTSEVVVDYLTEFSGIEAGDLDPNNSPHTLVPLKAAYKKLRLLVDLGCIFVGHGLSKDFRTINIFVPPEQVMDTVLIYTLPGSQRKLSLRFLAWYLLHQDIQTNSHDSIEDAHFALLLCKLWMDYSSESEEAFEMVMEDIFAEGKKLAFKPPNSAGNTMAEQQLSPRSFTPLSSDQTVAHAVVKSGMATPPPPTRLGLPQWASQNSPSPLRR
ncbi:PAB-dependent poly(A)-specific ribonuclease subunit PAN2 [Cryptococcus tetragattii IND107]|uniref:PAN2-PAN3 deadenylation complex catalytic subunit PAN2 n=1 Tax=Cryptococcus tetragattii IND107 TaxID=1296105 RepID=A0ABR3BL64_9TREE|nr:PAB-dependent poly(A)-specific ribonuclease subunit PAN2 [Cryptococcus tetragattii IND107]